MFTKQQSEGYRTLMEGIEQKTLVYGEKTSLSRFHLKKGSVIPAHSHPHEQTGYLLSGQLRFSWTGKPTTASPGTVGASPAKRNTGPR